MLNLKTEAKFTRVEASAVAGQSTLTGDTIDMQGFASCTFLALLGDVTATSVLTLTVHHSDEANANFVATEAVATFTAGASDADNGLLIVEVLHPRKRYLRAVLTRGTADAVVDGIVAIQTNPADMPTTQPASVIASALSHAPASAS